MLKHIRLHVSDETPRSRQDNASMSRVGQRSVTSDTFVFIPVARAWLLTSCLTAAYRSAGSAGREDAIMACTPLSWSPKRWRGLMGPVVIPWQARGTSLFIHKSSALRGGLLRIPLPPSGSAGQRNRQRREDWFSGRPSARIQRLFLLESGGVTAPWLVSGRGLRLVAHANYGFKVKCWRLLL